MIDTCIALDQSVSPHTGVRAIQNTGVFLAGGISNASSPLLFLDRGYDSEIFNFRTLENFARGLLTIPPAAQANVMQKSKMSLVA